MLIFVQVQQLKIEAVWANTVSVFAQSVSVQQYIHLGIYIKVKSPTDTHLKVCVALGVSCHV